MSEEEIKNAAMKKEIGRRFAEFRQSIKKSQYKLANELKVCQSTITYIETGKIFPGITFQNFLYDQYNLNINWLLTGKEDMLISPEEKSNHNYFSILLCHIDESDPRYAEYVELFNLMHIPAIEQIILGKLAELKVLAEEEIKSFFEET
jgi:transcriptional regulator with XRE-family HTH domain